jgi:iron(III) transport system permease protein
LPALLCAAAVLLPLGYLVVRSLGADPQQVAHTVFRRRSLDQLSNTLLLAAAVVGVTTLTALPAAWLTSRSDLPVRRFFALALVLPLAIPGYLMAYALLSLGGDYGVVFHLTGTGVSRLRGFVGAVVALSVYNFPYMLLNLRAGLSGYDTSLEEVARSLGHRPARVFFSVVLPQLAPSLLAGALLVSLHVITDFGVVSLMGYETFSYALYYAYESAYGTTGAAPIALMMIALAGLFIVAEVMLLRRVVLTRAGAGQARRVASIRLRYWKGPAVLFLSVLLLIGVALPALTIVYWAFRADIGTQLKPLSSAVVDSLKVSVPAAVAATLLALPIATMARRYPSRTSVTLERLSFLGYATPSLAFALGLLVVTLHLAPGLRHSAFVLVYAYSLHFLAEAVGPVRAGLFQANPRLEEASRALGHSQASTFARVTLPLLRPAVIVSLSLVFLSSMKELPLTMLLAPLGFETLSMNIWQYTENATYAPAAPYALCVLGIASLFVGVLLYHERGVT